MTNGALSDRLPPYSLEAEASVLGSMLIDNDCIAVVIQMLTADDFYSRANRETYTILTGLFDRNKTIDVVILSEELKKRNLLDSIGGLSYIQDLASAVPSSANAEYYAQIVKEKSTLRKLITTCHQIMKDAYESGEEVASILDKSEYRIFEIAEQRVSSQGVHIGDIFQGLFEKLDKIHDREGRISGIPTGYYKLDDLTGGFQTGEFIVIAGRPSMGKTSFALSILGNVAVSEEEEPIPVALFSLEMAAQQIAQNLLCAHARISSHKLRTGQIPNEDLTRLSLGADSLSKAPIFIDDTSGISVIELRAKARRLKAQHNIGLVIVDYMQLMEGPRAENRQQQISQISRGLKALARELNVPVVALSQLNRAVETREGHKPRMSDLRESGAIEQDADVVILLHREEYYNPMDSNKGIVDVNVVKQRNGPTGSFKLQFQSNY
ncbi:MAG: replicative DNA helicase, partial [Armatimonadetes bacterium]|nr:replicative DNA helicase [Armatimonadota bacterium]